MTSSYSKPRMIAWVIWLVTSLFYAYQYILRVMPNIMLQDIMQQFHINASAFGQFSGVYYIGYSLLHLPVGILLDRFGPKKVMSSCILLTVIGMTPLLFANHWAYPVAGRFLIGLGSSAAILGLFKVIRITFSEKRFSHMLSFSVMIGLLGAIYGGGPISYMRDLFGYQTVIQILSLLGITLAAITYWIVPNMENSSQESVVANIREVLSNRRVLFTCICAGLMVGPLEGFADVWSTAFLKQVYDFDGTIAASLPSIIFIGMCFGAPLLNFIAEKIKNHLITIIGAGILMVTLFTCLLTWLLSPKTVTVSFILIGMCCAYQILAIYKASTYVRAEVAGLTTAVANMIIMIFGYAFHTTMGGLINSFGGISSSSALSYGVTVVPIALFLGTLGFIFLSIKEKSWSQQHSLSSKTK